MESDVLYSFVSHTSGKNARVSIFRDRIEWERKRGVSGGKMTAAALTGGLSLAVTGVRNGKAGSEMIPVKNITSVLTKRDGMLNTIVSVVTSGSSIDFRVSHAEAKQIREVLNGLMLGGPASTSAVTDATVSPREDIAGALQQLAALHAAGVLTDEEFAAKKAALLARL
ncbi:SHOCT domain-containing protein [Curtobacterium sp. USHLN213]|uniref:SHOCT domain-containing protein n=1 Tax=Curtobacterium sp. USHLN213 TaxID=3081255 RepID=UPI003015D4A7